MLCLSKSLSFAVNGSPLTYLETKKKTHLVLAAAERNNGMREQLHLCIHIWYIDIGSETISNFRKQRFPRVFSGAR